MPTKVPDRKMNNIKALSWDGFLLILTKIP